MMMNTQKEIQVKLTKGLLDVIVLQMLKDEPMHGYQIITNIRRSFGVYFGPSTVYPMLSGLEKKGYLLSEWHMDGDRPRKVYTLTPEGQSILSFTEASLNLIRRSMAKPAAHTTDVSLHASVSLNSSKKTLVNQALSR